MPEFEICNRPNGTWFIHFRNDMDIRYAHVENVIEYMNKLSEFLDDKLNLGLDGCYSRGMNWKEAAEHVYKNMEEDCARQVLKKCVDAQARLDDARNDYNIDQRRQQFMIEAANQMTYGYRSNMSTHEKYEQMCLNKFALDRLMFEKL